VSPVPPSARDGAPAGRPGADRVDSLVTWIGEIDARLRVAEVATGDEKTAKELRKAVEAAAKYDPKLEERLGNRVDVLADRLASLSTTVSTTAAALARKDGEIAALRRELDESKVRVDATASQARAASSNAGINAEISELRKSISNLSEQKLPRKIEGRLDDLKASVGGLNQRLETLSSTVSTTASGLAGREGEVAALRRQLDEEHAAVDVELARFRAAIDPAPLAELREAVKTFGTETGTLKREGQRRHDALAAAVEGLTSRIGALTTAVTTTTQDLASSNGRTAELRAEFDEENKRVDSLLVKLHQATGELSARVVELGGVATSDAVDALGADLSALARTVGELGATVAETAKGYTDKEYEIAALGRRFEEINTQVDAGVRELRASVTAIAERGTDPALDQRLTELAGRLEEIASDAQLEGRVDRLDAAMGGLATELAKLETSASAHASDAAETLTGLERRLEELAALAPSPETSSQTEIRLEELAAGLATLGTQIAGLDDAATARSDEATVEVSALGERFAELESRLEEAMRAARVDADERATRETQGADERALLAATTRALQERVAELDVAVDRSSALLVGMEADLAASAQRTAQRDGELQALDDRFRKAGARVDVAHAELVDRIDELAHRLDASADASLETRIEHLDTAVGDLATELASLSASSAGSTDSREALTAVETRLDELAALLPPPESTLQAEGRLGELASELATLAARIAQVEGKASTDVETLTDERASLVATTRVLEERVAELGIAVDQSTASVAALEADLATNATASTDREDELRALSERFQESSARVDALVGELRSALETMPAPVSAGAVEEQLAGLSARLEDVEQSRATAALEIARASATWSDERASIHDRLEHVVGSLAELESRPAATTIVHEQDLAEITERLERAEGERAELAAEIAGATAFWSSGLGAIEARVTAVTSAKEESTRKVDDEVVRALFDIARRLDAVERGHAEAEAEVTRAEESWAAERDSLSAGLDDLTRRLDVLDGEDVETAASGSRAADDDTSDGRSRLGLRALELRMEHTEAAARENREAVLVQLERLASRIEWRLQRLETGNADDPLPEVAGGSLAQVVQLHGGDA
jgi:chromosome segregation ATPase